MQYLCVPAQCFGEFIGKSGIVSGNFLIDLQEQVCIGLLSVARETDCEE